MNGLEHLFGGKELFVDAKGFRAWAAQAHLRTSGLGAPPAVQAAMEAYAQRPTAPAMVGDVAVIDVTGPISYKSSWLSMYFGIASIQDLQQQFRTALADSAARTIIFRVDSPGGVVDMMPEFADEIFAARGPKPILVVADTLVASCAYWLASQADTIYATTSAQLGAIGVYCEHDDISGLLEKAGVKITLIAHGDNKVDGNPYEPLSDTARAEMQANVDEIGGWFDAAVARGRGVDKSVVLDSFGQGKVFRGKQAISIGLADKAGTFTQVLSRLTKGRGTGTTSARATVAPAIVPVADTFEPPVASAHATGAGSRQVDGCQTCSEACPCDQDEECPADCPECDPMCPCVQPDDEAKKKAAMAALEAEAATNDEIAGLL